MERVMTLQAPAVIGRSYLVPCVRHDDLWWPVLGRMHADPVLGDDAAQPHLHVDLRFVDDVQLRRLGGEIMDAYHEPHVRKTNLRVFILFGVKDDAIREMEMPCLRGIPFNRYLTRDALGRIVRWTTGETPPHFSRLEDAQEGKALKGACKVCPHQGVPLASMPVRNGVINCPAHNLDWSARTGGLVRRTKRQCGMVLYRTPKERKADINGSDNQRLDEEDQCLQPSPTV